MNAAKEQIKKNVHDLVDAITSRDWKKAGQYYGDNCLLFESGSRMSWPEQREMFQKHIQDHQIKVSFIDLQVSEDGTMALCLLDEDTNYVMGGKKVRQNTLVTTVWKKKGDNWKLVHFNRSVNPAEIPEAQMQSLQA